MNDNEPKIYLLLLKVAHTTANPPIAIFKTKKFNVKNFSK